MNPEVTYVRARLGDETLIVAEDLVERVLGEEAEILEQLAAGRELVGRHYAGPVFELGDIDAGAPSR